MLGCLPWSLCAPAPQKKVSVETGILIGALTAGLLVKGMWFLMFCDYFSVNGIWIFELSLPWEVFKYESKF